jgi:hypothetical protein
MVAVLEALALLAVTVTLVLLETVPAVVVKMPVVEPAATVTEEGTVRAALLLERLMDNPPTGAGADSQTVHVAVDPEVMLAGLQVIAERAGGTTNAMGKSLTGATAMLLAAAPRLP